MTNDRNENRSPRASSQEDSADRSDISLSYESSPNISSTSNPTITKKQKMSVKMAEVAITDKNDDTIDVSEVDHLDDEDRINLPKATTTHKKSASKITKKPAAKTKLKPAARAKKDVVAPSNETPTVSDAENEMRPTKASTVKRERKRASTSIIDRRGSKKVKLPANAYNPDRYEDMNKEDKTLFDLKTENPKWTWNELVVQFNLKLQGTAEVKMDALRKRWPRVKAAATEIDHGDIQRMCVYKRDMEVEFEKEKDRLLRKYKEDMWKKIATYVAQEGGNNYDPDVLQRKYGVYQRYGRIDEKDNYTEWTKEDDERKSMEHSMPTMDENDAEAPSDDGDEADARVKAGSEDEGEDADTTVGSQDIKMYDDDA